eukprot:6196457-Pleurochrysis_carterae.AAC.2
MPRARRPPRRDAAAKSRPCAHANSRRRCAACQLAHVRRASWSIVHTHTRCTRGTVPAGPRAPRTLIDRARSYAVQAWHATPSPSSRSVERRRLHPASRIALRSRPPPRH